MAFRAGDVFPRFIADYRFAPFPPFRTRGTHDFAVSASSTAAIGNIIETDIPSRLDALPFGRFHLLVVMALGVTWILDGLEVTLAGALSGELKAQGALALSNAQIGLAGSGYLAGAVCGAFFFGWLTDRLGRKKLFTLTLAVYLLATAATGLSWNAESFIIFRFITGAGIGGEYAAINSTIQELIPARFRGWTDLLINGSFWIGAALGAAGSLVVLDPNIIDPAFGWRLAFLIGATIGLVILVMRIWIPESPRWLVTHGFAREADTVLRGIEAQFVMQPRFVGDDTNQKVRLRTRNHTPLREVARTLFVTYRQRTLVGLSLMAAQAFFYNAIFFTYALVLTDFYGTPANAVGWYILPFAAGNVLGPLLLGRLFDTIGRKTMIASTYALSGLLLAVTAILFGRGLLTAHTLTAAWMTVFFFASAAASSAYLTVSEIFPLEIRALAIAFFYAVGTAVGGIAGPLLFGFLIDTGSRSNVALGYVLGAVLMIGAAAAEALYGIAAERKPLESVAQPLALAD
ncbi:MAG TPA: MFS transporter [Xanthobacteraceae bacterium]|jgi:MFS family permease|nr:MFS transporter [Xanthobacteraceae bacterium]